MCTQSWFIFVSRPKNGNTVPLKTMDVFPFTNYCQLIQMTECKINEHVNVHDLQVSDVCHPSESVSLNPVCTSGHCNFTLFFYINLLKLRLVALGSAANSTSLILTQILYWTEVWALTPQHSSCYL